MIIDNDSFQDLSLTLKAQGDVVLLMAKQLAQDPEASQSLRHYVTEMNNHLEAMGNILRAVKEENHAIQAPSGTTGRA
jgi:hypothetical protein